MESRSLKTLKVFGTIGRIACQIAFAFCTIGVIGCLIGIICLACMPEQSYDLGWITVYSPVVLGDGVSRGTAFAFMAMGAIICLFEGVTCWFGRRYFKNALAARTPFTLQGAREMLQFGIAVLACNLAAVGFSQTAYMAINYFMADVADAHIDAIVTSSGVGLLLIAFSFVLRYGAEVTASSK